MPTFNVSFTPPAAPDNFSATADTATASVTLEWDAYGGSDFFHYRVFRTIEGGERELIETVESVTETFYVDHLAPIGSSILYEVTVMQGSGAESDPASAETALAELGWWLVRPGVVEETFQLRHVEDYSDSEPLEEERMKALGRASKIVVQGDRSGKEGVLQVRVAPEDRSIVEKLRAVGNLSHAPDLLLKTPFGEIYHVSLGTITRRRGQAGHQLLSVPYTEIGERISDQTEPLES